MVLTNVVHFPRGLLLHERLGKFTCGFQEGCSSNASGEGKGRELERPVHGGQMGR